MAYKINMMLPNPKGNRYTDLGVEVLKALAKNQLKNGTIYDKVDNSHTPDDHYAHTFFALASYLSSRHQNACERKAEKALEYFVNIPDKKKGHHEFNLLACLLLNEILKQRGLTSSSQSYCFDLLTDYIKKGSFEAGEGNSHGNNWVAIQALDLLLRYHQFKIPNDLRQANHLIDRYVLRWQLPDGIFYDTPRSPKAKYVGTPLTYHAKFCMILSLFARLSDRYDVSQAVVHGLDAFSNLISPNGEGFYFGRTNNAIFGYVSALYAYETAIQHFLPSKERNEIVTQRVVIYRRKADALFSYLKAMQDSDGSLRLTPGSVELHKAGWDTYMHHTVYNAYAAALLLMTPYTLILREGDLSNEKKAVHYLENSGFFAIKHERNFLVLNTKGQNLDPRYAGMIPLAWCVEGEDLLPSPPVRREDYKTVFMPVIYIENKRYIPENWRGAHIMNNETGIIIFSEGVLTRLRVRSRMEKGLSQLLESSSIVHDIMRTPPISRAIRAWKRGPVPNSIPLKLYRRYIISHNVDSFIIVDTLRATEIIEKLMLIPPSFPLPYWRIDQSNVCGNKIDFKLKNVKLRFKFEILWPRTKNFNRTALLDTSKGVVVLLTPNEVFRLNSEGIFHSVVLLHAYEEGKEPNYQVKVVDDKISIHENSNLLFSIDDEDRNADINDKYQASKEASW